jgi:hypothetical protein
MLYTIFFFELAGEFFTKSSNFSKDGFDKKHGANENGA